MNQFSHPLILCCQLQLQCLANVGRTILYWIAQLCKVYAEVEEGHMAPKNMLDNTVLVGFHNMRSAGHAFFNTLDSLAQLIEFHYSQAISWWLRVLATGRARIPDRRQHPQGQTRS